MCYKFQLFATQQLTVMAFPTLYRDIRKWISRVEGHLLPWNEHDLTTCTTTSIDWATGPRNFDQVDSEEWLYQPTHPSSNHWPKSTINQLGATLPIAKQPQFKITNILYHVSYAHCHTSKYMTNNGLRLGKQPHQWKTMCEKLVYTPNFNQYKPVS